MTATPLTNAPRLTTDRLCLRGPEQGDLAAHTQWVTTSPRMEIIGGNGTPGEARFAFLTNIGRWQMDGMGFFTVTLQDDPTPLGRVGMLYYPQSALRPTPEFEAAWHLYDSAEGKGFATEAARAVIAWTRATFNPAQVVSFIDPKNTRSKATAERLGASNTGTRVAHDESADVWLHKETP